MRSKGPSPTIYPASRVNGRVTIILRTGWHEVGGQSVFVLPGATIGRRGSETVILDGAAHGPYEARGSLEDWQAGVGRLTSGHALPVLAISAALAGPLLHLAGQEGGGRPFSRSIEPGQNDALASRGERVGVRQFTRLCAGVARDGERLGRRGGERDGYRSRSR